MVLEHGDGMEKMINLVKLICCIALVILLFGIKADARYEISYPVLEKLTLTCYTLDGTTADGTHTRKGICALKNEWLGKTCVVWGRNDDGTIGEYIGIYECTDVCPKDSLIDIWFPKGEELLPTQKVYVQLVDAVG